MMEAESTVEERSDFLRAPGFCVFGELYCAGVVWLYVYIQGRW